ncbi:MAG: aldo/keto reductase [Oscillospiraceae bacterium]|nr:aldo/keto reductase [Oscillospiraceae bacterium]
MVYTSFKGLKLPALGLGTMRLPVLGGKDSDIDEALTEKMIDYCMEKGANYFDTGWDYHSRNCESTIARLLRKYPRESYYFAAKFPGYNLKNMDKVEEIFEEQLRSTGLEYFDFYLFHNVCELNIEQYLDDEKYGVYSYLMKQKAAGRIKHLGFSSHGALPVIKRFLEKYGKDMEFGQLQLNWLDWEFQQAKEKVALLRAHSIPVWVMEPLRGGKLAKPAPEAEAKLAALRPDESVPGWAFRFLQAVPEVQLTLSGMSNFEQLQENIAVYEHLKPLTAEEMDVLFSIAEGMTGGVPCTGCRYCVSHCPQELDIPSLLSLYYEHSFTGGGFIAPMALRAVPEDKRPQACLGCGSCEQVCPQQIKISQAMANFSEKLAAGG